MILLRTQTIDDCLSAFADELEKMGGLPVAYVVDERKGNICARGRAKISLTQNACEAMGLYCPQDFAWRCGDYGLYLARAEFPNVEFFWQIESDVRIAGDRPEQFFSFFSSNASDLLASYLKPASDDWPWLQCVDSRDHKAYQCFFPVVRLSGAALDLLLEKRRAHSTQALRRHFWANDESFVATTVMGSTLRSADFNEYGRQFYSPDEFSFESLTDGDAPLSVYGEARLLHPVLFAGALIEKQRRLADRKQKSDSPIQIRQKIRVGINALIRSINTRRRW